MLILKRSREGMLLVEKVVSVVAEKICPLLFSSLFSFFLPPPLLTKCREFDVFMSPGERWECLPRSLSLLKICLSLFYDLVYSPLMIMKSKINCISELNHCFIVILCFMDAYNRTSRLYA